MTIHLYAMHIEQRFKIKQIYQYASDHLRSWFPLLPSCVAFNMRLNRLGEAFKMLSSNLISIFAPSDCIEAKVYWIQCLLSLARANAQAKWPGKSQIKFFVPQKASIIMG